MCGARFNVITLFFAAAASAAAVEVIWMHAHVLRELHYYTRWWGSRASIINLGGLGFIAFYSASRRSRSWLALCARDYIFGRQDQPHSSSSSSYPHAASTMAGLNSWCWERETPSPLSCRIIYSRKRGDNLTTFFRARMIRFSPICIISRTMTNCTIIEQGYIEIISVFSRVMIRLTLNWGNFDARADFCEANWSTPVFFARVCDEYWDYRLVLIHERAMIITQFCFMEQEKFSSMIMWQLFYVKPC